MLSDFQTSFTMPTEPWCLAVLASAVASEKALLRLSGWHSRLSNDDGGGNRGHDERGFLS